MLRRCVSATYPHTPAGCCRSRSRCGSSRCTWRTGLNTARSCRFRSQTSHTRLHLRSERQLWANEGECQSQINDGERTYEGTVVFHRGNRQWQQSTAMRAQFVKIIWKRKKEKSQREQWSILVCFFFSWETNVDFIPLPGMGQAWISQLSPQPAPTVQQHSCLVVFRDRTLSQKFASLRL